MKPIVIADDKVPFLDELLGGVVELRRYPGREINRDVMADAEALITRTRTRCDAALLDGTACRCVATAAIGTDHIDFDYCNSHGITVASAPGCNAPAVAQYVHAALQRLGGDREVTLGIVGAGHVGKIVEQWARALGMKVLICDPPRAEAEGADNFVSLEDIARECNFITFHTPYTRSGRHATHHLAGEEFFNMLQRKPVFINSARGPIVDTRALLRAMDRGQVSAAVIDCWEGEPDINPDLLDRAAIATPHIAGYSIEGKRRASIMAAEAVVKVLGLPRPEALNQPFKTTPATVTAAQVKASYDPTIDTRRLKASPETFESQRDNYNLRHEI